MTSTQLSASSSNQFPASSGALEQHSLHRQHRAIRTVFLAVVSVAAAGLVRQNERLQLAAALGEGRRLGRELLVDRDLGLELEDLGVREADCGRLAEGGDRRQRGALGVAVVAPITIPIMMAAEVPPELVDILAGGSAVTAAVTAASVTVVHHGSWVSFFV